MPGPFPFSTVSKFFNTLCQYRNEDDYTLCTALHAGRVAGMAGASVKPLVRRLDAMGVLKVYTANPENLDLRAGEFMLIKITGELTEEVYAKYFLDKFEQEHQMNQEARRKRLGIS